MYNNIDDLKTAMDKFEFELKGLLVKYKISCCGVTAFVMQGADPRAVTLKMVNSGAHNAMANILNNQCLVAALSALQEFPGTHVIHEHYEITPQKRRPPADEMPH